MPGGFAIRAYLKVGAPSAPAVPPTSEALPARPEGQLIWFHLAAPAHRAAAEELIRRLRYERRGTGTLMTGSDNDLDDAPRSEAAATRFLDHWQPDMIVLVGGELLPAVIDAAHWRGIPVVVIDAAHPVPRGGWRWWPGVSRALARRVTRVLTQDSATLRAWRRMGAQAGQAEISGRMEEGHSALPCTEAERDELARLLRARPVWLAMALPEGEEAAALAAHREALSLRHRLLMVIVPENPGGGADLARRLEQDGWDVAVRSRDEEPSEADQIYIADTEGELGLWYRLAPVTYFGGTLSGKDTARHPYEAAALGSAILHGPKTGVLTPAYARLGKAGAARVLRGVAEFGVALSELLAPDRAAQMAHNAWEITSSGAEVTDRVVQLLLDTLDDASRLRSEGGAL